MSQTDRTHKTLEKLSAKEIENIWTKQHVLMFFNVSQNHFDLTRMLKFL